MRVVSQDTSHVRISGLSTATRLLGLPGGRNDPRPNNLVLVCGRDTELLKFFLHLIRVRNLDLLPDVLELVVKVLDERWVIGPYHLGVIVLLISSHEQLSLFLHRVDSFLGIWPALLEIADTHSGCGLLVLEVLQELLGAADVMGGTESERALAVSTA